MRGVAICIKVFSLPLCSVNKLCCCLKLHVVSKCHFEVLLGSSIRAITVQLWNIPHLFSKIPNLFSWFTVLDKMFLQIDFKVRLKVLGLVLLFGKKVQGTIITKRSFFLNVNYLQGINVKSWTENKTA